VLRINSVPVLVLVLACTGTWTTGTGTGTDTCLLSTWYKTEKQTSLSSVCISVRYIKVRYCVNDSYKYR